MQGWRSPGDSIGGGTTTTDGATDGATDGVTDSATGGGDGGRLRRRR